MPNPRQYALEDDEMILTVHDDGTVRLTIDFTRYHWEYVLNQQMYAGPGRDTPPEDVARVAAHEGSITFTLPSGPKADADRLYADALEEAKRYHRPQGDRYTRWLAENNGEPFEYTIINPIPFESLAHYMARPDEHPGYVPGTNRPSER